MTKSIFKVIGVDKVAPKLKAMSEAHGRAFNRALRRAGLLVQRAAQEKTPVDTGILRKSARTEASGAGFKTEVSVSFSSAYAIYVHEDLEANHEVGEAKFLERAAMEKKKEVLDLIKNEVSSANP
jgi:hypothetical protein